MEAYGYVSKSSRLRRIYQRFVDSVAQSTGTWPLVGPLKIAESHEPVHCLTTTRPPLSVVIFDRDGTLIEDTGCPVNPAGLIWQIGALKAITWLRSQGVIVAVATNQSGVA